MEKKNNILLCQIAHICPEEQKHVQRGSGRTVIVSVPPIHLIPEPLRSSAACVIRHIQRPVPAGRNNLLSVFHCSKSDPFRQIVCRIG